MRASEDSKFVDGGRWGQTVEMVDATFRMLSTGASWSGNERNHLFVGRPGEADFDRVSGISGLDDGGDSMSAALLDFDRDGWMDVALGNNSKPRFRLLRNEVMNRVREGDNGFVALRLVGGNDTAKPADGWSARDALGARVEVEFDNGRTIVREHSRDGGFKAQRASTMLIGIGNASSINCTVFWPSGREQAVTDVDAGTLVTLYENEEQSPMDVAAVRENYAPAPTSDAAPTTLRIEGAHGAKGLTVYTTMSTFCAVCMKSQPDLKALRSAFGEDLTLVGIPVASIDTVEKLQDYVKKKKPAYAVQIGLPTDVTEQVRATVAAALHTDGQVTPASIITDSTGRILTVHWGVPTLSELRKIQASEEG